METPHLCLTAPCDEGVVRDWCATWAPQGWVVVSGSRTWQEESVVWTVLDCLSEGVGVRHGAHRAGADAQADRWARARGRACERFPADWETLGRAAGPRRNAQMIATAPAALIAFRAAGPSPGTDGCVRMARRAGIAVLEISL